MIRHAKKEDLEIIVELWKQMSSLHNNLDNSFKLKIGAEDKFAKYAEMVIYNSEKLSIVYDHNSIIGYLFAEIINQPPVYLDERIGIITEISVDSNYRRKGIGETLLHYSENWIKENGVNIIDCQVATKNPMSVNFWNKNGFQEHSKICRKLI